MYQQTVGTINKGLAVCALCVLRVYRYCISPMFGNRCRFYPNCSHYAEEAVRRFGVFRGGVMVVKRLLCCHPFHPGGYDPVPSVCRGRSQTLIKER